MNGKGDKRRQEDTAKFRDNWDKIKWPEKYCGGECHADCETQPCTTQQS